MTTKQAEVMFEKLMKKATGKKVHCDCCGGKLPPKDVYELVRDWDCDSGDCDGSVDSDTGHCRAFSEIGW